MSVELDQLRVKFEEGISPKTLKIASAMTEMPITKSCKGQPIIQAKSKKQLALLQNLLGRNRG